ncbi:MAG: leucine-rich repeat domain-containing protein [Thermoguttaceae bacterium]|nr:leucine-rich repeat domain-containing protein [Thermoguttaceae bacterium]
MSSSLKREKRRRVKRWAKTGCVLCVSAALVGGWAAATVGDEKNATSREARLQALDDCRKPISVEELLTIWGGMGTPKTFDRLEVVYRKILIDKDWTPKNDEITSPRTTFQRPEFYADASTLRKPITVDGKTVWSFFDEFEVDPENPRFKSVDGVLLSKDGKTLYRYSPAKTGTSYRIPDGVVRVAERAFAGARFESVKFPESLKTIEKEAFIECDALKSVAIPRGVVELGDSVFFRCDALETVEILAELTTLPRRTFSTCPALTTVKLPSTLTTIRDGAFGKCRTLKEIKLPESTRVVEDAFSDSGLKRVNIPRELQEFPTWGFYIDAALEFEIAPDHPKFRAVDGVVLTRDGKTLLWAPRTRDGEFVVPDGVETIAEKAFKNARFSTVKLPESLRFVEEGAFWRCDKLTRMTIPQNVERVEWRAFLDCVALKTVEILTPRVVFDSPFDGCSALEAFEVPASNEGLKSVDGALLSKDGKTLYLLPNVSKSDEYAVPDGVERIVYNAFRETSAKKIKLPASVVDLAALTPQGERALEQGETLGEREVEVAVENKRFSVVDGALLSKDGTTLYLFPSGLRSTEWRVPDSVERIARGSIVSDSLETLVAPSVKDVDASAISAPNLKTVVFSEKLRRFPVAAITRYTGVALNLVVKIPSDAKIFRSEQTSAELRRFKIENVPSTETDADDKEAN